MAVPYTFATATSSIPLSQLDSNFATPITLGNTSIQLGNTVTTLNNMTLANVTVSSVASTFPNNYLANSTATLGNATITLGGTTSTVGNLTLTNATISSGTYSVTDATVSGNLTLSGGTANGVAYLNGSKVLTTGSALTFDGTTFSVLATSLSTPAFKLFYNSASQYGQHLMDANGIYVIESPAANGVTGGSLYLKAASSLLFGASGSEQMRLTSTGLGIGTSSPAQRLHVSGAGSIYGLITNTGTGSSNLFLGAANAQTQIISRDGASGAVPTVFIQGTNESARITSGGDLLVGTTDASVGSGPGIKLRPTGDGVSLPIFIVTTGGTTSASAPIQLYSTGAGAYRFYVNAAGTIFATSTTITAISDQRLKENIQDLDVGLDKIMALKPRKFDWKPGKGKDKKGDRGWIAQEFEQVFPDMVTTWLDPAPEGEEPYKAVNADLIPVLVKALQEQQAIINQINAKVEAQAAEIAALKSK